MSTRLFNARRDSVRTVYAAALLSAALSCTVARAADPLDVQGLLATPVHFVGDAREKVATACLDLLATCTASGAATEANWQDARRSCHLYLTLAKPRTVAMNGSKKVELAEAIVGFPLTSGRIWVRSGDKVTWFAKYSPQLCKPIQGLLKEATPDE